MLFYAQALIKPNVLLAFSNVKTTATVLTKASFVMVMMIVRITLMKRTVVSPTYFILMLLAYTFCSN